MCAQKKTSNVARDQGKGNCEKGEGKLVTGLSAWRTVDDVEFSWEDVLQLSADGGGAGEVVGKDCGNEAAKQAWEGVQVCDSSSIVQESAVRECRREFVETDG